MFWGRCHIQSSQIRNAVEFPRTYLSYVVYIFGCCSYTISNISGSRKFHVISDDTLWLFFTLFKYRVVCHLGTCQQASMLKPFWTSQIWTVFYPATGNQAKLRSCDLRINDWMDWNSLKTFNIFQYSRRLIILFHILYVEISFHQGVNLGFHPKKTSLSVVSGSRKSRWFIACPTCVGPLLLHIRWAFVDLRLLPNDQLLIISCGISFSMKLLKCVIPCKMD